MFLKKPLCPFPPDSPEAAYFQILTPYAFGLLKTHFDTYLVVHIVRDVDEIACELSTSMGRMVTTLDACPCVFRRATGLPCRHIMAVRYMKQYSIFDATLVPDRWTRAYNVSRQGETQNGAVALVGEQPPTAADPQPSVAPAASADQSKIPSTHVRYKRASEIANELVKLVAEAPASFYLPRLKQMKKLRDAWRAEKVKCEPEAEANGTGDVPESAATGVDLQANVTIGGDDICDVTTVGETELIDIANSVCYGMSTAASEQAMKYSDIKLPGKIGKRGRPSNADRMTAGPPKKRSKLPS